MADVEQMADRPRARRPILDQHAIDRQARHVVVVEDDRRAARQKLADALGGFLVAVHDEAIDAVGGEEVERVDDRCALVVVAVGEQGAAGGAQPAAQLLEHRGVELAQRRNHEAHRVGEVGLHGGGKRVAAVAEALDRRLDQVAVSGADGQPVEVSRDRADRDARLVGDVDDGRRTAAAAAVVLRVGLAGLGLRQLGVGPVLRHQAVPSKTSAAWMCSRGTVTSTVPSSLRLQATSAPVIAS